MIRDKRYWDELDRLSGYPRDTDAEGLYPGEPRPTNNRARRFLDWSDET